MAIQAFCALFALGVSMGLFNALICELFPVWDLLWPPISRASLHFSGLYFVAEFMSPNVRKYFALNPLIHGVNWFRHAFYPYYPDVLNNHAYPLSAAAIAVVMSLCLQRVLDRRYYHAGAAK
jgi:capsular polysaccharide transport system permease protein